MNMTHSRYQSSRVYVRHYSYKRLRNRVFVQKSLSVKILGDYCKIQYKKKRKKEAFKEYSHVIVFTYQHKRQWSYVRGRTDRRPGLTFPAPCGRSLVAHCTLCRTAWSCSCRRPAASQDRGRLALECSSGSSPVKDRIKCDFNGGMEREGIISRRL